MALPIGAARCTLSEVCPGRVLGHKVGSVIKTAPGPWRHGALGAGALEARGRVGPGRCISGHACQGRLLVEQGTVGTSGGTRPSTFPLLWPCSPCRHPQGSQPCPSTDRNPLAPSHTPRSPTPNPPTPPPPPPPVVPMAHTPYQARVSALSVGADPTQRQCPLPGLDMALSMAGPLTVRRVRSSRPWVRRPALLPASYTIRGKPRQAWHAI